MASCNNLFFDNHEILNILCFSSVCNPDFFMSRPMWTSALMTWTWSCCHRPSRPPHSALHKHKMSRSFFFSCFWIWTWSSRSVTLYFCGWPECVFPAAGVAKQPQLFYVRLLIISSEQSWWFFKSISPSSASAAWESECSVYKVMDNGQQRRCLLWLNIQAGPNENNNTEAEAEGK